MTVLLPEGLDLTDVATYGYKTDRWNFVEGEALAGIVSKLNKEQNRYVLSITNSRVVWRTLLFYMGATLVRVTDLSWRPEGLTLYFVGLRGQYRRLDGGKRLIHFMNEKIPLKLSATTVIDYLRFYCFFVRWQGRPFILVENFDDLGQLEAPLSDEQRTTLASSLHPITVIKEDPTDGYELKAVVRFGNSLFDSTFNVSPKGQVKLLSELQLPIVLPPNTGLLATSPWPV